MLASRVLASGLLLSLAACGSTPPPPQTTPHVVEAVGPANGRLPSTVAPLGYGLELTIVPSEENFSGKVDIRARVASETNAIFLHGQDLVVARATVTSGSDVVNATYTADDEGFAKLALAHPIPAGEVTIHIEWSAPFPDDLQGLYRVETAGEHYAFTQFEALSARRAFPCFDEPGFKVPFDVSLIVASDHVAVANTRSLEEAPAGEGRKRVHFALSEPLPTYLIAFAVGPFDVVEGEPIAANESRQTPIPFRGIAPKGRGEQLAHAMRETPRMVASLEAYFGIGYPYDKLDIIAVPDFEAGAMENPGAITFRDTLLLLDPASTSSEQTKDFAFVTAHELAHMWFGDLVTMAWWDDIWLNEGFASWMEMKVIDDLYPELQPRVALTEWVQSTMNADSLESARSVRQPIASTHDIHNAFDAITYGKGAAVLSMFEQWLTPDVFRAGVKRYLEAHRNANATSDDLLEALSAAAERDVAAPFRSFIGQPGVPLLAATSSCEEGTGRVSVAISRSLPAGSSADTGMQWQVPVCVRYGVGRDVKTKCEVLASPEATMELEGCPTWLLPNSNAAGYYRFTLPEEQLAALRREAPRLATEERLAIADAIRAAFDGGRLQGQAAFDSLRTLSSDPARAVATSPMDTLEFVSDEVLVEGAQRRFQTYARGLYSASQRRLGWTERASDDADTKAMRTEVTTFLAEVAQDSTVRRDGDRRGRAYLGIGRDNAIHADAVPADLAGLAVALAAEGGDAAMFDAIETLLHATTDGIVRERLVRGLASFQDPALAERARNLMFDERMRRNERLDILGYQLSDRRQRDAALAWLEPNLDRVLGAVPEGYGAYVPLMLSGFCSAEAAEKIQTMFGDRIERLPGGPRNFASAIESVLLCEARVDSHRASANAYFGVRELPAPVEAPPSE